MSDDRRTLGEATVERVHSTALASTPRVAPTARLVVVYPLALAQVIELGGELWILGRQGEAGTLRLAHPTISRAHLELRHDPSSGRWWLRDLGSRNGTWLEGQPVGELPRALVDGAVLRLGDVLAIAEIGPAISDPPEVDRRAIPGSARAIRSLRREIAGLAGRDTPALVIGDTGVGKERIASELHRLGGRRGAMIVANCAALSATLIESQLFGHDRGAFTGASQRAPGLFRAADGGTLILDEIGELPLELQPKLLRAIEYGEVMPVGASRAERVDVRVVGVTHRDLAQEVELGRFRRDLYGRLALGEVRVPALRQRQVDLLAWLDRLAEGDPLAARLTAGAAEVLLLADWPENLRGLHRLALECQRQTGPIAGAQLPAWIRAAAPEGEAGVAGAGEASAETPTEGDASASAAAEPPRGRADRPRPSREELLRVLEDQGWSIRGAARHFERDRKQISRWIERYAITIPGR